MPEGTQEYQRGVFEGQVLQKLADIEGALKVGRERAEKKHEELKKDLRDAVESLEEKISSNESRVAKLEQWRWWLMGGFGVVAFFVTFVANVLSDKL